MAHSTIESAIEETYGSLIPVNVRKLIALANDGLYNGPIGSFEEVDGWPGFSAAIRAISDAIDDVWPGSLYFDEDCGCLMEREPEGEWNSDETGEPCDSDDDGASFYEPMPYYEIECKDFYRAIVGRELASYL